MKSRQQGQLGRPTEGPNCDPSVPTLQASLGNQETLARLKQNRSDLEGGVPKGQLPHRREMERAFGLDLGAVRVVLGVPEIREVLGANAATDGEGIVFASSSPTIEEVAHEVAHLKQQQKRGSSRGTAISDPSGASEKEASEAGKAVARGEDPQVDVARDGGISRNPALAAPMVGGGVAVAPILAGIGIVALAGLALWGGYVLMSKATGNQSDSGLRNLSDEEVSRRARDTSLSGEERRRYQKEEKARGLRNKQKRQGN